MASVLERAQLFFDYCGYEVRAVLGEGASGTVYHCTHRADGQDFAIKVIDVTTEGGEDLNKRKMALNEIEILEKVAGHENIIELLEAIDLGTCFVLVFELAQCGDLDAFMDRNPVLPEHVAFKIIKQILAALGHCHSLGIVHRDVKPKNILIDAQLNVKLIDFGLAAEVKQGEYLTQGYGTMFYYAPEMILTDENKFKGYRFQIDAFACGVVLYQMLSGLWPYDRDEYFEQLVSGQYYPLDGSEWESVSEKAKWAVNSLLETDPSKRMSAILAALFF